MLDNKALNPPDLNVGLDFYYQAYLELSTEKKFENGPIPYSSMEKYTNENELSDGQFQDLMFFCNRLEETLADFLEKKSKRNSKLKK